MYIYIYIIYIYIYILYIYTYICGVLVRSDRWYMDKETGNWSLTLMVNTEPGSFCFMVQGSGFVGFRAGFRV